MLVQHWNIYRCEAMHLHALTGPPVCRGLLEPGAANSVQYRTKDEAWRMMVGMFTSVCFGLQEMQQRRLAARRHRTTFCFDFPDVFENALRGIWAASGLHPPHGELSCPAV